MYIHVYIFRYVLVYFLIIIIAVVVALVFYYRVNYAFVCHWNKKLFVVDNSNDKWSLMYVFDSANGCCHCSQKVYVNLHKQHRTRPENLKLNKREKLSTAFQCWFHSRWFLFSFHIHPPANGIIHFLTCFHIIFNYSLFNCFIFK